MTEPKLQPHNPCLFAVDEAGRGSTEIGLRDLFAAFAVAGHVGSFNGDHGVVPCDAAGYAYEVADAMLAARENP